MCVAAGRAIFEEVGGEGGVEGRNAIDRVVLEPRHWIAAYQGTPWPTTQFRGEPEIRATVTKLAQTGWGAAREGTRYRTREANGFPT